ncbi:MAG TPA: hypothetical protein VGB73_10145 [Pyrinomonadaceae bacterium]|jgi:hypothetical protein
MKAYSVHLRWFFILLLIGVALSCARHERFSARKTTAEEALKVEKAVAEFHSEMNQEQYGQIWEKRASFPLIGARESYAKYLGWIQNKYGAIVRSRLVRSETRLDSEEPQRVIVDCWYETEAKKGRYVDAFLWHITGDETKLALHQLLQFDEKGQLYMILTLHTGLGPNDFQQSRVYLGRLEEISK